MIHEARLVRGMHNALAVLHNTSQQTKPKGDVNDNSQRSITEILVFLARCTFRVLIGIGAQLVNKLFLVTGIKKDPYVQSGLPPNNSGQTQAARMGGYPRV